MTPFKPKRKPLAGTSSSSLCGRINASLWRNVSWLTSLPPYEGVPHLRGNALTGRIPYLLSHGPIKEVELAAKLAESSDSGMCSFWSDNQLILLVTKPEYVYEMKMFHAKHFNPVVDNWNQLIGKAAINDAELGPQVRKVYQHTLADTHAVANLKATIDEMSDKKLSVFASDENEIKDAGNYFRSFALAVGMRLFMNVEDFAQVDCEGILTYLNNLFEGDGDNFVLKLLNLKSAQATHFFSLEQIRQQLAHIKKQRLTAAKPKSEFVQTSEKTLSKLLYQPFKDKIIGTDNLIHTLWKKGQESHHDASLTLENLFPDAFFFLTGGLISSLGDAFPIIIKLICEHPEVLRKLSDELEEMQRSNEDLSESAYLDQVIKECFRINPPVPLIPTRQANASFDFHGVQIKAGDKVLISPWVNHHSTKTWSQPEIFDPERFAPDRIQEIPKGAYIPFSLGPRDCIGKNYCLAVLKSFIAKLIVNYDITLNAGTKQTLTGPSLATSSMSMRISAKNNTVKHEHFKANRI